MEREKKPKKKVLEGYKKVGKNFIPPMKQIPKLRDTSYVNDILPELIWAGLIHDSIGFVQGARFLEDIFRIANNFKEKDKFINYAYASNFNKFSDTQKKEFIVKLEEHNRLDALRTYLSPLTILYKKFPLSFIGPPQAIPDDDALISLIKTSVGHHIDKYETPGIVLNGVALLSLLVTDQIRLPPNLPDFNAVINSPDSDEANLAAGFMRANILTDFNISEIDNSWAKYFWNRGAELSECEYLAMDSNDE